MTLTAHHITVRLGENTIIDNFSYTFQSGITCILGPSGCGKTTLLRTLMGLITPDAGEVSTDTPMPRQSVLFQENRLIENMSAISNIRFVCPKQSAQEISGALSAVGLGDSLHLPVRLFSGGMQRRVALVRALLAEFDVLFLDEPFTGLDENTRDSLLPMLYQYTANKTALLVTHDETLAGQLGARVLRLG